MSMYTFYMENVAFLKMDIFFIVTTTVVVLLGALGVVILYYIVKIVQKIYRIMATVEEEAQIIARDFKDMRKDVKAGISDVRIGITTATNYTKMVAGTGIVKALSGLFEAFAEEKNARFRKEEDGDEEDDKSAEKKETKGRKKRVIRKKRKETE